MIFCLLIVSTESPPWCWLSSVCSRWRRVPYCHWYAPRCKRWHDGVLLDTLRPRQNGCHFADEIFKCIFLYENAWILIKISLKFVPKGPINNIPALVQIMAWRRPGDKPLYEPMMLCLLTHIYIYIYHSATFDSWLKRSLMTWHLCPMVVRHVNVS